ncbi:MAG: alpha/beta fold hydrolase [Promethearchaeota archaeon]
MIVKTEYIQLSKDFRTESGDILRNPVVAYEEFGTKDGSVVFVTHGGLQSHHVAGKYSPEDEIPGSWDALIGPGKAIDTEKFRVISANALGSMYGTTSPLTINPDTGKPYGSDFPEITLIDMVNFYKAFFDELGIDKLLLMIGPSMGALQNLQMAALYPNFVSAVVSVATAGRMPPSGLTMHNFMINALKLDPAFNNGNYKPGTQFLTLKIITQFSRIYFFHERAIKMTCWDNVDDGPDAQKTRAHNCNTYLTLGLEEQLKGRDPNCYITILSAINTYDLGSDCSSYEEGVQRIKCPVMLININTDSEFQPFWAQEVVDILNKRNPGQARLEIIDSPWGHVGCLRETEKLSALISKFISEI